jgi:uncharacterized membrane protein
MQTKLWAVGLVLLAALIGSFGPILLKKASKGFRLNIKALITNYYLIGGVAFYGIGTVLFIPALRGGELSTLYPIVSTTYIWVSLLSLKLLNEKMSRVKWLGILLIIVGVSFIGFGS